MAVLSPRAVTVITVLSVCLAAGLWFGAAQLRLVALLNDGPYTFGLGPADIRVTPEQLATWREQAEGLRLRALLFERSSLVLLAIALAGTVVSAYRARRAVRSWPWVSLIALVLIGVGFVIGLDTSMCSPSMLAVAAIDAIALAGGVLELVRSQRGSARRVLAGSTIALSLVMGWFAARAMLHPSGILGRWFDGAPPC